MRHLTHDLAGMVISMAWSPDSKHLATVEEDHGSLAKAVHIRSQAEGPRPVQFPQKLPVTQVTWSPDGTTLALSGPGCPQTVLIDAATGAQKRLLDNLSGPVAWRPDGSAIAGIYETSVLLVDPATGGRVGRLADHEHRPTAVAWARHGGRLAVADGEKIRIYDADTGDTVSRIPWTTSEGDRGPDHTISSLQWLDGGRYLLEFRPRGGAWHDEQGSTCSTLILWDVVEAVAVRRTVLRGDIQAPPAGRGRRAGAGRQALRAGVRRSPARDLVDRRRPAEPDLLTNDNHHPERVRLTLPPSQSPDKSGTS